MVCGEVSALQSSAQSLSLNKKKLKKSWELTCQGSAWRARCPSWFLGLCESKASWALVAGAAAPSLCPVSHCRQEKKKRKHSEQTPHHSPPQLNFSWLIQHICSFIPTSHQYSITWSSSVATGGPSAVACSYRRPHEPSSPTTNCSNTDTSQHSASAALNKPSLAIHVRIPTWSVLSNQRFPLLENVPPPWRTCAALRLAYLSIKVVAQAILHELTRRKPQRVHNI